MTGPLDLLEREWASACQVLFGRSVGGLLPYKPWLCELSNPVFTRPSMDGGPAVTLAIRNYPPNAQFLPLAQIDFSRREAPIGLNQIKDLDSLAQALRERAVYCGEVVLGSSQEVQGSCNVSDSYYVLESSKIDASKCAAYCTDVRLSERLFGCMMLGAGNECLVRCEQMRQTRRSFEAHNSNTCSDCHYVASCEGCQECLFCFNLHAKSYCIGNQKLERSQYLKTKAHLKEQMADELEAQKRLPSLFELVGKCAGAPPSISADERRSASPPGQSMAGVEEAFARTSQLVLGKPLRGLDHYAQWLERDTYAVRATPSAVSKKPVLRNSYPPQAAMPANRLVRLDESAALGELAGIGEEAARSFDFSKAVSIMGPVAYMCPEKREGQCLNSIDCPINIDSGDCYRCSNSVEDQRCAYSFWPRNSDSVFGCQIVLQSASCLKCYNSVKLQRCFECDSSFSSSDCLFCHNIENCSECMFCFNVKAKRYAIGNVEYPKEEFLRVKKMVLAEVSARLEKDKNLGLSIYSIGSRGKK
ncbi:Uncharacterised protein [uncultured archaeon]|nr:Uncharacterised protein [uncultured archaeon]